MDYKALPNRIVVPPVQFGRQRHESNYSRSPRPHHSGGEEIARQFPSATVVKAFNAIFAEVYAAQNTQIGGRAVTVFFAGDDPQAKAGVRELIMTLGFDAVDAGLLANARYLEPLSLLNIHLGKVLGFGTQIGFSLLRKPKSPSQ
jgi:hypothetical protein